MKIKTPIMSVQGSQWKINVLLLAGITIFIPRILSLQNQRYDYIDVAKETAGSRSKGQTTRIFTTDDELDEKFWLKYLGEDFRHAVHLQIDGQNNVVPSIDEKPANAPTFIYSPKTDDRTRFVRQPSQEEIDKQSPVEYLDEHNVKENQYPTENPETFDVYPSTTTTATTTTLSPAIKKQYYYNTEQHFNVKKSSKNKNNLHNKYSKQKACRVHKTTNEPIVVHLPQRKSNRRFFRLKNQLYAETIPNLSVDSQDMEFYSQPLELNTQHFSPQPSKYSHQTHFTAIQNTNPQHKRQQHLLTPAQYTNT